jgi:XRE family transcriptional regulator, regulator of sulfur utilization
MCNILCVRSIDDVLREFGIRVQQLRQGRGWTQEELAGRLGVLRPYLGGIECGDRNPSLKTIAKIATSLGIDIAPLVKNLRSATASGRVRHPPILARGKSPVCLRYGRRVQTLREARGWSVARLALKVGFPRAYLSGIERGVKNPSLLRMARIAKTLEADLSDFFRGV